MNRFTALFPLVLGLLTTLGQAQLVQSLCSSQNTGSSISPTNDIYQSNGLCSDLCRANYAFAIIQYQDCWCSNTAPANTVDVSRCNQDCPGYPDENCGNSDDGLFGYIALSLSPSGTAGAPSSQTTSGRQSRPTWTTTSSSTSSEDTSTTEAPSTSAEASPSRPTTTPPASSSSSSSENSHTSVPESSTGSLDRLTSTSRTASTTADPTPVTNTQVVTVSGAIVTQTITSTPRPRVTGTSADLQEKATASTSPGVIAGAVIGSIAGVALILGALFLCWRKRRRANEKGEPGRGINRNPSVLSKAGLLATGRAQDPEKSMEEPRYGSQRQSTHYDSPESPVSAPGAVHETPVQHARRNSRPLVYDQRLNPAAIMQDWQGNGSRTSIGTMQDQRDYSRPLGVTNPDPDRD